MGGETDKRPSSWTIDSLRELTDIQIKAVREEARASKELLQAENASTAEALKVARNVLEKRLEGLNELRSEVTKDREQFVKSDVYVPAHEALRLQRVSDNEKAIMLNGQVIENSKDIAGMKSSLMWLTRLIAGAIVLALITYAFRALTGR